MQWFEVLWLQVVFPLHLVDFEVDEASVREHHEPLLPVAEETFRLLPERSDFPDAHEVVAHDFAGKVLVSLRHFLLQALVTHD